MAEQALTNLMRLLVANNSAGTALEALLASCYCLKEGSTAMPSLALTVTCQQRYCLKTKTIMNHQRICNILLQRLMLLILNKQNERFKQFLKSANY